MKKKIISLFLAISMVILVFTSCVMSDYKYDYDMTQYVSLAQVNGITIDVERDTLQKAIDNQLLQSATQKYRVKKGDDVCVNIKYYELVYLDEENKIDQKGDEITAIEENTLWIRDLGSGSYSAEIEARIIGNQLNSTQTRSFELKADGTGGLPTDYADAKYEPYYNKGAYLEFTIINKPVEVGNIVGVEYVGYYCEEDGTIKVVDGEEQSFDKGTSAFYPGSKLAIDDFENNLIGANFNEEKTFQSKFPDDYYSEELRGQNVIFKVKVVDIFETPIYDLDYINNNFGSFTSIEEFENETIKSFARETFEHKLLDESSILKYPEDEYKMIKKELDENDTAFASSYGMGIESYVSQRGLTLEQYIKDYLMHDEMIIYAFCRSLGFNPSEDDLTVARTNLINGYAYQYMQNNENMTSDVALIQATQYVDDKLGKMYIYEEALYEFYDAKLPTLYSINIIDETYTSITKVLNGTAESTDK